MYSYDYSRKTAASIDVWQKYKSIVEKHRREEEKELQDLLKDLSNYFRSNGMDLDLSKSYMEKIPRGSDGYDLAGSFRLTEREENSVKLSEFPPAKMLEHVRQRVEESTNLWCRPKLVSMKETPRGPVGTFDCEFGE